MTAPLVAIGPEPSPDWVRDAVVAGGGTPAAPGDAEMLVWTSPRGAAQLERVLSDAPGVRVVQLPWAGVEEFAHLVGDGRIWLCGKGVYAEPVAEHALALALAGLRDLPERVAARGWGKPSGESLYDGRATILGGGGITAALLALLAPLRVDTTVVRRQPTSVAGATRTVGIDRLHDALGSADVVFLALALTPQTAGIIAAPALKAMAAHAWLVNVARGGHVVTDDLVQALREGWIGGAALDVTDPEPLPEGHPLWELPNCIITPHVGNTPEMARAPLTRRITENVCRLATGEPLIGPVDPGAGY